MNVTLEVKVNPKVLNIDVVCKETDFEMEDLTLRLDFFAYLRNVGSQFTLTISDTPLGESEELDVFYNPTRDEVDFYPINSEECFSACVEGFKTVTGIEVEKYYGHVLYFTFTNVIPWN